MKGLLFKGSFLYVLLFNFLLFSCNQDDQLKERELALKKKEDEFEQKKAEEKTVEEEKPKKNPTQYALVELKVNIPDVTSYMEDVNQVFRELDQQAYEDWSARRAYESEIEKLIDRGPIKSNHPTQPEYVRKYNSTPHNYNVVSDVLPIENYTIDAMYKVADSYEKQLQTSLSENDSRASLEYENHFKRTSFIISGSRILHIFETYSEASTEREKLKNRR